MHQPELGKKILEIRTTKGLTQEDLVEKCNVSVRTIQRIESGEVMPRNYTIKTILAALDHDFETMSINASANKNDRWYSRLFPTDINAKEHYEQILKLFNVAWIFGVLYFIVGFFEGAADYFLFEKNEMIYNQWIYIVLKLIVLVSYFFFQRGIYLIGILFKNTILKIISIVLIALSTIFYFYDIASVFYNGSEREFIMGGAAFTFGAIGILYGRALYVLKNKLGRVAKYAGVFEILSGCFFLTIIFSFIGFITLIPAELFEIIILFKMIDLIKIGSASSITTD